MKSALVLLLALGLSARATAGGEDVERGQRVRVTTTAGERLTGRVLEMTADAILLELERDRGSRSISRTEVAGLETRGARSRSRAAWSKAKWGALIGAVSGTTLGFQHEQIGEDGTSVGGAVALGVWSGGLFGGLIGAAVGALRPGEEWVNVSPRVHLGTRDRGFSLSVTLEF